MQKALRARSFPQQILGLPLAIALVMALTACGGGGEDTCSVSTQKNWVRSTMDNLYYWRDQVTARLSDNTLLATETTATAYYQKLFWSPANGYSAGQDHFSYVETEAARNAAMSGQSLGYGISWVGETVNACNSIRVKYVQPGSPADLAGVQRGDTLTSINGGATPACQYWYTYQRDLAYPTTVVTAQFGFSTATGGTRSVTLTAQTVEEQPVLISKIITGADNRPVGYLMFNTFMATKGRDQLIAALTQFKTQGIQDLVLDLRYNGGGFVYMAADLAAMITGPQANGRTFLTYKYNAQNSWRNETYTFPVSTVPAEAQLNLSRVYLLTTGGTASASELVINGLKPVLGDANVIQIGTTSYGKPVGMLSQYNCGNVYSAINFEAVNANGAGGYFNGIAPTATCTVSDNLSAALGEQTEPMLAAALRHRASGSCTSGAAALRSKVAEPVFSPLMDEPLKNNMYR